MTIIRAMVLMPKESGIPEDTATNTFHFNTGGVLLGTDATDIAVRLSNFYNATQTIQSVGKYLSREFVGAACRLKMYDLSDTPPRVPIYDELMPITENTGSEPLVSEVACCLSYHTAPESGVVAARRRGRIYLGPLNVQAQAFLSGEPMVSGDLVGDLIGAANDLVAADTALLKWSVYSPTDNTARAPVTGGWVDNAFDTQRRRGPAATTRTTWPV